MRVQEPLSICIDPAVSEWLSVKESARRALGKVEERRQPHMQQAWTPSLQRLPTGAAPSSLFGSHTTDTIWHTKVQMTCEATTPASFWVRAPVSPPGSPFTAPRRGGGLFGESLTLLHLISSHYIAFYLLSLPPFLLVNRHNITFTIWTIFKCI